MQAWVLGWQLLALSCGCKRVGKPCNPRRIQTRMVHRPSTRALRCLVAVSALEQRPHRLGQVQACPLLHPNQRQQQRQRARALARAHHGGTALSPPQHNPLDRRVQARPIGGFNEYEHRVDRPRWRSSRGRSLVLVQPATGRERPTTSPCKRDRTARSRGWSRSVETGCHRGLEVR